MAGIYINEYHEKIPSLNGLWTMTNNLAGIPSICISDYLECRCLWKHSDSVIHSDRFHLLWVCSLYLWWSCDRKALLAVDDSFRQRKPCSRATKLQTIRKVVLPIAMLIFWPDWFFPWGRYPGETVPILFGLLHISYPNYPLSTLHFSIKWWPFHCLYVISTSGTKVEESRDMAYGTGI